MPLPVPRSLLRSIFRPALCALLPLAILACHSQGSARDEHGRRFRFTYEVEVPPAPAGTELLRVWVPLPKEDPGVQEVSELEIQAPEGSRITTEPTYDNRMVYVALASPTGPTHLSWSATIDRSVDHGQGSLASIPAYLRPTRRVPIDGSAVEIARALGVADASAPVDARAKRIYDDVLSGMDYDKSVPGYGLGDFERSITVCKGNCTDFHSRFLGVGRAAGIPVRFTMGVPLKASKNGAYKSYHCWAHYFDGAHWQPVDISESDKLTREDPALADTFFRHLDPNRISLTFGRDIVLEPAQAGGPLNYFVFPFAEADGNPMPLDKSAWRFTYEDV